MYVVLVIFVTIFHLALVFYLVELQPSRGVPIKKLVIKLAVQVVSQSCLSYFELLKFILPLLFWVAKI